MLEKLLAVSAGLRQRFPNGNEPFQMMTRLLEEAGELAQQVNHFEGSGVKRQKHGEPDQQKLAKEIMDVLRCAIHVAQYYGVESELETTIERSYQRLKTEGHIQEQRFPQGGNQPTMKRGKDYIGVGVGAIIADAQGRLFLSRRGIKAGNERGLWEFPGGAVEFGETLQGALQREMREEYGIEIAVGELLDVVDHLLPDEGQHWVSPTFLCTIASGEPRIIEPEKCADIGWFLPDEIPAELSQISQENLRHYLHRIGFKQKPTRKKTPKAPLPQRAESAPIAFTLPASWQMHLQEELQQPYIPKLAEFVQQEYATKTVYPPVDQIFAAFTATTFEQVKVVILGQDPYHGKNQANGLAFSVNEDIKQPPSLKNIFLELQQDLGVPVPKSGNLMRWAEQGVLLLNALLTVAEKTPRSHQNKGWERFTDAVIRVLSEQRPHMVFLLWGAYAQQKGQIIANRDQHLILESPHPSPYSAFSGFFGCRHFSQTNAFLEQHGLSLIKW